MATQDIQREYDLVHIRVEPRAFARCEEKSGEQIMSVTVKPDGCTAVLVFECKATNKPHIRTVILHRDKPADRWDIRNENTVALPYEHPTSTAAPCLTTNTRETVPSITPSVTLNGTEVQEILACITNVESEWCHTTITTLLDTVRAALSKVPE